MKSISWSEFKSQLKDKKGLALNGVDQFSQDIGASSLSDWQRIPNWEEIDDAKILSFFKNVPNDDLIVISEVCYTRNHDPMLVNNSFQLNKFASKYFEEFGESLFNGDLFIFSLTANYVGIFHHEGLCYEGELTR